MNEDKKCKDLVQGKWDHTEETLRELFEAAERNDDNYEELDTYALSCDYVEGGTDYNSGDGYFRYQMSWGGPSDELRFYAYDDGEPYTIEYWYLDWFDGASVDVTGNDMAERVWSYFFSEWAEQMRETATG